MIDTHIWLAFLMLSVSMCLMPGPAVAHTVTQTLSKGVDVGISTVAGNALGILLYTFGAAFGIAFFAQQHPELLFYVKIAGATYLLYMGMSFLTRESGFTLNDSSKHSPVSPFWQALWVSLLNPKVALMLLVMPFQFVAEGTTNLREQIITLGVTHTLVASINLLIWMTLVVFATRRMGTKSRLQRWLHYTSAGFLVTLGFKVMVSVR